MISVGWYEARAEIVALRRAGHTFREIADLTGWGTALVARVCGEYGVSHLGRRRWSDDEKAAVRGCRGENDAVRAYRYTFPDSKRSDQSIIGAYRRVNRQHGWLRDPVPVGVIA